ncbi:MAG: hypothetical protein QMC67_12900 [Candidatus Wallbacteria bacterium]
MNNHSISHLKEAVLAVIKGDISFENALIKYSISSEELKSAIKNYCLTGVFEGDEAGESIIRKMYKNIFRFNFRNLFNRVAPTYDKEKELDRFKFKLAYTMVSCGVVAAGIFLLNFPNIFLPSDMRAQTFEGKVNKALLTASNRPQAIDAEVKYLNRFYSRINKILAESDTKESKELKAEIDKRMEYIGSIDRAEIAKKAVNFTEKRSSVKAMPESTRIYKKLYEASVESGDSAGYIAKTLKQRSVESMPVDQIKKSRLGNESMLAAQNADYKKAHSYNENVQAAAMVDESAPLIEDSEAKNSAVRVNSKVAADAAPAAAYSKSYVKPNMKAINKQVAEVEIIETSDPNVKVIKAEGMREESIAAAETANVKKAPAAEQSAKNTEKMQAKAARKTKKYESLKDKLYIAGKYNHKSMIKQTVPNEKLEYKYPVSSMFPILEKDKYEKSIKKIASQPKEMRNVEITEERG